MADDGRGEESLAIPLRYEVPLDIETKYATHMIVHHSEHEFVIFFFEVQPPLFLGTREEMEAQAQATKSVTAKCVARITIAAERMPSFVEALQTNLQGYLTKRQEQKE